MNRRFFRPIRFAAFAVVTVAALGFVVSGLWNLLIPSIFAGPAIGFWQALGLLALARILVGGWRGGGWHGAWRARMMERWERMSPEEREAFRAGMSRRCGRRSGSERVDAART